MVIGLFVRRTQYREYIFDHGLFSTLVEQLRLCLMKKVFTTCSTSQDSLSQKQIQG